jgi:D123
MEGAQWGSDLNSPWPTVFVVAPAQVLLLLQSSDRIAHDICHAFDGCASSSATPPAVTSSANPHAAPLQPSPADAAAHPQHRQQGVAAAADGDATAAAPATLPVAGAMAEERRSGQNEAAAPVTRPQHVLALRAWRDLRPGREFRCFVRGREVVGGSSSFMCSCC